MAVARALAGQDAVVRIGGGVLGHRRAEAGPDLHALEDEIDPVTPLALHPLQPGAHVILLARSFFGPLDGNLALAREVLNPLLVLATALAQDLLGDGRH